MENVRFVKASGAGNDFILIDARRGEVDPGSAGPLARALCRRRTGIGADGLILIIGDLELDFAWRYFNSDGSEAEMCGNGARCAARFAYEAGIAGRRMRFRTLAGPIEAEATQGGARITMPEPRGFVPARRLRVGESGLDVWFIDSGVPHAVVFVDDLDSTPVVELGRALRFHEAFAPAGANADFIVIEQGRVRMRTYERGVEDETLACGTGAVASALISSIARGLGPPAAVVTRSGETLTIDFKPGMEPGAFRDVTLEGPARMIASGEILPDAAPGLL